MPTDEEYRRQARESLERAKHREFRPGRTGDSQPAPERPEEISDEEFRRMADEVDEDSRPFAEEVMERARPRDSGNRMEDESGAAMEVARERRGGAWATAASERGVLVTVG